MAMFHLQLTFSVDSNLLEKRLFLSADHIVLRYQQKITHRGFMSEKPDKLKDSLTKVKDLLC